MLGSAKLQSLVQSRSFTELDECNTFWLSIRSHEQVEVKDLSAFFEKSSDVWVISVEWESLDTGFEFSFFLFLSVLSRFDLFGDNFNLVVWGLSGWDLFRLFFLWLIRFLNHLDCLFGSLDFWLDLLFALLFALWYWFFLGNDWLLGWGFSLLEWWFSGLFSWLHLFFTLTFFTLFNNNFLCLDNWLDDWRFGSLLDWLDFLFTFLTGLLDYLFSWNCLGDSFSLDGFLWGLFFFWAFFTWLLNLLFWNNCLLGWGFSLDNLLWGFFFTFFRRGFWFLDLLWNSIFCLNSLDWLALDLWGLFFHCLWGFCGWFSGLRFGDWGLFLLAGFLNLRFLFGLFLGIDLLFLWYDQRKWAWWVFFWVLW